MYERELKLEQERQVEHKLSSDRVNEVKMKLKVYLDNKNQRMFIDNSAAYALKLITYEEWVQNENGYYEITIYQLEKLSKEYEIEYIELTKKKLKVYLDNENQRMFIDNSAAYALKLITYEEWVQNVQGYYKISTNLLEELSAKYEIEYSYAESKINITEKEDINMVQNLKDKKNEFNDKYFDLRVLDNKYLNNETKDLPRIK